jgi:regulator of sigma E protease
MLAWLAPILVFGLVIFVHELGHFLAAKSVGVYAPRFSIGFGPALWRRRKGETEYVLAAFPLGGYVRMASRLDEATAGMEGGSEEKVAKKEDDPDYDPEAMIPFGPKPVPEHRWFESKPLWARLYILLAGVTMNIILGLVVAIGLAAHFGKPVIAERTIGSIRPINGKAWLAPLTVGDRIERVNGEPVRTWNELAARIVASKDSVRIETGRAGVTVPLTGEGAPKAEDVASAMDFALPPIVGDLLPGDPGAKGGLKAGDTVLTIDGEAIASWSQMVVRVARSADKPITMRIGRADGRRELTITPKAMAGIDPVTGERGQVGKLGAYAPDISTREPVTALEAVSGGVRVTWGMATGIVGTVRDLFTRKVSMDQLGGPIAITRASVTAARSGMENLWYLIALLSVNVAVLNLLPIPILDGGQILINILESAKGSPFTLRSREYILRGGLFFILLLFVFVMFNDVKALLFG